VNAFCTCSSEECLSFGGPFTGILSIFNKKQAFYKFCRIIDYTFLSLRKTTETVPFLQLLKEKLTSLRCWQKQKEALFLPTCNYSFTSL
jgi:hypothetical protein